MLQAATKQNIDSGAENRIPRVNVKSSRIPIQARKFKIEFLEICNEKVAAAAKGLIDFVLIFSHD